MLTFANVSGDFGGPKKEVWGHRHTHVEPQNTSNLSGFVATVTHVQNLTKPNFRLYREEHHHDK